ncbi:MAG TPA: ion transporter, partial [Acidothermaceae bacterium]
MVLALTMAPLLVVPFLWDLSVAAKNAVTSATWVIWALFVVEYGTKLYLAPDRRRFLRTHVIDLLVIVVPFLRPLRVLRVLRVAPAMTRGLRDARAIVGRKGIKFTALVAVVVVFASAGTETALERGVKDSNIHGFGDALWWAMTT